MVVSCDKEKNWVRLCKVMVNRVVDVMNGPITALSDRRYHWKESDVQYWFTQLDKCLMRVKLQYQRKNTSRNADRLELLILPEWVSEIEDPKLIRFHELMCNRMNDAIRPLNRLINLSNRSNYLYYPYRVNEALNYVEWVVDLTLHRFVSIQPFEFSEEREDVESDEEYQFLLYLKGEVLINASMEHDGTR